MRIALAYVHMHQSYVGGLLRRAARRLGLDVVTIGPAEGSWIGGAPVEDGWEPDVEVPSRAPCPLTVEVDALINVNQGDGFYAVPLTNVPVAHVFTEGNEGEYAQSLPARARAVWSLQPWKVIVRPPDVRWLEWGYDPEHTPLTPARADRPIDLHLRGSAYTHRLDWRARWHRENPDLNMVLDGPVARGLWGAELLRSKMVLQDHRVPAIPGRITDAVMAGALVLSLPNPIMDIFLPRAYVPVATADEVPDAVRAHQAIDSRAGIIERAQQLVAHLTWDNQLLRVLASIGVRA